MSSMSRDSKIIFHCVRSFVEKVSTSLEDIHQENLARFMEILPVSKHPTALEGLGLSRLPLGYPTGWKLLLGIGRGSFHESEWCFERPFCKAFVSPMNGRVPVRSDMPPEPLVLSEDRGVPTRYDSCGVERLPSGESRADRQQPRDS